MRFEQCPELELTALRYVSQNRAWACQVKDSFAVEFPERDLRAYSPATEGCHVTEETTRDPQTEESQ